MLLIRECFQLGAVVMTMGSIHLEIQQLSAIWMIAAGADILHLSLTYNKYSQWNTAAP